MTVKGENRLSDIQPEQPEQHTEQTLHIKFSPEEVAELDAIVRAMKRDPKFRRLRLNLGREKAVKHAVGHFIDHVLEQVESRGG
jgi:hypothetical protein